MKKGTDITRVPVYSLYGESAEFPDVLHCEHISDRAHLHDWHISPHRHPNLHQIFLITEGHASMTLDGTSFSVPAMSVVSVPRHCVHGFVFEKHTKGFVLSIPSAEMSIIAATEPLFADFLGIAQIVPVSEKAINVIDVINQEHQSANCARIPLLRGLMLQFFCYVVSSAVKKRQKINPVHNKVSEFEALARDHFIEGWKVSDYALSLGISTTHLNRLCRKVLGQSPQAFLFALVIQEAKRLLAYTRIDVASVGYRIGFEDPSYFSRAFMRSTGKSPRAFRKMYEFV